MSSNPNYFLDSKLFILVFVAVVTVLQCAMFLLQDQPNDQVYTREVHEDIHETVDYLRPKEPLIEDIDSRQPFNHTNPYSDSWCPNVKCYNSPLCTPCDRRYLFIIATGRSGSTTLLKMFNELPNVRLSGENFNELYLSSKLEKALDNEHFVNEEVVAGDRFMSSTVDGAFKHNPLPIGFMSCAIQNLVNALNPPLVSPNSFELEDDSEKILGMKVIRIPQGHWFPYQAAKFFKDNFPCARFIINYRSSVEEQIQSWSDNFLMDVDKSFVDDKNKFLKKLQSMLGDDRAKLIDMDQWKDDIDILNGVLDWLGYENCAFNAIPHENHDGYRRDKTTTLNLGESCTYPH